MKRALLIGINKYPFAPLAGCVNDVQDMRAYLLQHGWKRRNIKVVTEQRATAARILKELALAIERTGPEDTLYVHYSGHGLQVPSITTEEPDGLDECLCPVDFNFTPETTITDNQLALIFAMKQKTAKVLFMSDSCHSGDLQRGNGQSVRTFHSFLDVLSMIFTKKEVSPFEGVKLSNFAIISAARANQTAADACFNQRANGAATYFFLDALLNSRQRNLEGLLKHMNEGLRGGGFSQEPQLYGTDFISII